MQTGPIGMRRTWLPNKQERSYRRKQRKLVFIARADGNPLDGGLLQNMSVYLLALLIGIIAGLRTMTAPAAIAWTIYLDRLNLGGSWLNFLGNVWACWILTLLAIIELITDQLPSTPSRTVPVQFGARILSGALCGSAVGTAGGSWLCGASAWSSRRRCEYPGRARIPREACGGIRQ
jgi:hypothetical protein